MKKYIMTTIIAAMFVFNANVAKSQIPTVDFGNIAGTIGIVTQGITNVQQGIESIKNASNFISIVGDSVGTIRKFADKIKGYVQDVQNAIEKAKQRISEGMALYNKYKDEIEARKARYQELLANIPDYMNPNSYNDDSSDNNNSSRGQSPSTNQSNSNVNSGNSSNNNNSVSGGRTTITPARTNTNALNQSRVPASTRVNTPAVSPARTTTISPSSIASRPSIDDEGLRLPTTDDEEELEDSLFIDEEENLETEDLNKKTDDEENDLSQSLGRKAFGTPAQEIAAPAQKAPATNEKSVDQSSKAATTTSISAPATSVSKSVSTPATSVSKSASTPAASVSKGTETPSVNTKSAVAPASSVSKGTETPAAEISAPSVSSEPASTGFRKSPTEVQKRSQTIHYTTRLDYASEMNNSTTGSGYDKNGVFIFNVTYCDKSIDDMLTEEGTRECLVKIINKINDQNAHFAAENKKDCEKMVFDTEVALLASALQMVNEASNYQDTLDEQEGMGGNSNNTRDDTQVLAMSYEQTQLLLNKLTMILSGETILSVTKDVCSASINVLEENEVEDSSGGK